MKVHPVLNEQKSLEYVHFVSLKYTPKVHTIHDIYINIIHI
jgi:hypothetical protein